MWRKIGITLGAVAAAAMLAGAVRASAHERRGRLERHEDDEHEEHDGDEERGRGHGEGRHRGEGRAEGRAAGPASRMLPAYAKECGSCHLAFPPNLLPAASWSRMMGGLDKHFGKNAELEPEVRGAVERWLVERAGGARDDGGSLRLTDGAWFRRKHRKVEGKVARPSIKTLANCAACHPGAERWDFDEDGIVIPPR